MKDSQKKHQPRTKIPASNSFQPAVLKWDSILVVFSILISALVLLSLANVYLKVWIGGNSILPSPVKEISLAAYPELSAKLDPYITAQAAVAMDDESKAVLYAKNENLRFSMASTTKIMTALVALDYFKPDDILTVYTGDIDLAVVGFSVGEKVYFMDVLYGMLLPSGNDAAIMIAQNYPGGEEAFVEKMNEKAKSFNLKNTHFADSSGFSDDNYSTPLEMARLASLALQNKTVAKIVATKRKTITDVSGANVYDLPNLDILLDKEGITGVKTGYTQEAGGVLITSSEANGKRLILVVMKSKDRFSDIEKILSQIAGSVTFVSTHP
ncbi:MAG: D-alanyl-D-alanine carboxypeptidase [Candidatus Levybacteria bacterium]|nr:D-alanyl-D-alanine carboxypeptidase [Candidatus Levybacteria bacterium]